MVSFVRTLTIMVILLAGNLQIASAQNRPFRPVTITVGPTSVVRTQSLPNSVPANPPSAARTTSSIGAASAPLTGPASTVAKPNSVPNRWGQNPANNLSGGTAGRSFNDVDQRPTYQQLQNASGAYQLSHAGFSQSGYVSPNTYFGAEHNSWSNLSPQPGNLSSFESFNRFDPGFNSGGYYSPNTFLGPDNNGWNNLSSGSLSPNDLGGWNYLP